MNVDEWLEAPKPLDVLAAARVRAGRRCEGAADDEPQAGRNEDEAEAPDLSRNERRSLSILHPVRLEHEDDRTAQQEDRKQ